MANREYSRQKGDDGQICFKAGLPKWPQEVAGCYVTGRYAERRHDRSSQLKQVTSTPQVCSPHTYYQRFVETQSYQQTATPQPSDSVSASSDADYATNLLRLRKYATYSCNPLFM